MYSVADCVYDAAAGRGHVGRRVGRSEAELLERIHAEGLREASTFSNVEEALACIDRALLERSRGIHAWLRVGQSPMHRVTALLAAPTGLVVTRSPRGTKPGSIIRVILRRDDNRLPPFYVETAFLLG